MAVKVWSDHLGNEYESKDALCEAYQIKRRTFEKRLLRGMTMKEALTIPVKTSNQRNKKIKDPFKKNVYYRSYPEVAKAYGQNYYTLVSRIELGWSLKDALLVESRKKAVEDHLGNVFETQRELCDFYGIPRQAFYKRLKNGWDIKDVLSIPFFSTNFVMDKYGNCFLSKLALSNHYRDKNGDVYLKDCVDEGRKVSNKLMSNKELTEKEIDFYYEKNKDLFWKSHELVEDENGGKYLVCKLCGSKRHIKNMSESSLKRMISRIDGSFSWCINSCCVNAMSSIDLENSKLEEPVSTTNMVYTHTHLSTGVNFYHFTCPDCECDDLMTFEEIVEHLVLHKIMYNRKVKGL